MPQAKGLSQVSPSRAWEKVVLFPQATFITGVTTPQVGHTLNGFAGYSSAEFILNVASKHLAHGGTVNVYVQQSWDDGTTWDDLVSFTQITNAAVADGNWIAQINQPATASAADRVATDGTLAAHSVQVMPWADDIRVKCVLASFAPDDSVKVTVTAIFKS